MKNKRLDCNLPSTLNIENIINLFTLYHKRDIVKINRSTRSKSAYFYFKNIVVRISDHESRYGFGGINLIFDLKVNYCHSIRWVGNCGYIGDWHIKNIIDSNVSIFNKIKTF